MKAQDTLREEPTVAELIAAREQADAGHRLAFPMLFDGLGPDPQPAVADPEIDEELIGQVAAMVAHFRADAAADLKRLDKHAPRHIHREAQAVVAQCDEFLATVGDYFRGCES